MSKNERTSFDASDISDQNFSEYVALCPANEYRVSSPDVLPNFVSERLKHKIDSVFIIHSAVSPDMNVFLFNLNRPDFKASAVDQQPLMVVFSAERPFRSAYLGQHMNYSGRTTPFPESFGQYVSASGIGHVHPISQLPSAPSGQLSELAIDSHRTAFHLMFSAVQQTFRK
jgi:hypothetical protein